MRVRQALVTVELHERIGLLEISRNELVQDLK